jgi:excisionase family DNA binding protein
MPVHHHTTSPSCILLTGEQAADRLGIGRTTAFALIAQGRLSSVQIGHLRRVPVSAIDAFVEQLMVPAGRAGEVGTPRRAGYASTPVAAT